VLNKGLNAIFYQKCGVAREDAVHSFNTEKFSSTKKNKIYHKKSKTSFLFV